ncbi:MAG: hypothetical protein ACTSU2_00725 [Promethearchaeota archaeon]
MTRKRKTVLKGFLMAQDVSHIDPDNKLLLEYWNRVKNNLFVLMDTINPDKQDVVFLNNELKKIAKKYEGYYLKITIEPVQNLKAEKEPVPDPDEEYEGFEKFKRTMFSLFKIS